MGISEVGGKTLRISGCFLFGWDSFRVLIPKEGSRWHIRDVYMAHLADDDINNKTFLYQENAGRANLGLAGQLGHYRVWVENWQVIEEGKGIIYRPGMGIFPFPSKLSQPVLL